jgi:hypothetical protein
LSPSTLGVTGAVAAIVLVAQAATISILMVRDKTGSGAYHMAPGDPMMPAADGVQLLATLQPGATASSLTSALSELKATVLDGPTAGGVYRLRLAGASGDSPAGLAKVKAKADVFAFVGPAPR